MKHPNRFLALTLPVLVCSACGGGSDNSGGMMTTTGPATVSVQVLDNSYSPQSIRINPGDTVRWILAGSETTHSVTSVSGAFDSGFVFLTPGDTFERTFNEADQTFEYACLSHQSCCGMQGSVRVGARAPDPRPGY